MITLSSNEGWQSHPRTHLLARPRSTTSALEKSLLKNHLKNVAERTASGTGDNSDTLRYYIGAFHDFGKATAYFQEYVRSERPQSVQTNHGAFSALAGYFALAENGFDPIDKVIAWYAICRHHSHMADIDDLYSWSFSTDRCATYREQANALRPYLPKLREIYTVLDIKFDPEDFIEWVNSNQFYKDVRRAVNYRGSVDPDDLPADSAYDVIEAYGRLIAADRLLASGFTPPERKILPESLVDHYISQVFESPSPGSINALREAGRNVVDHTLQTTDIDTHRYTITLPTGLGKTLSGMHAGLQLRNEISAETGSTPRIIYVLPYTAIIDQNHDVFTEVYETVTDLPATSALALKHHYLSPGYHAHSNLDVTHEEASLLEERWESEIITTTYVQLLEGLLTPTPSQALRVPNLERAILILDEPQTIPTEYWQLVDDMLTWVTEAWDTYVISMTATQPQVADETTTGTRIFMDGKKLVPASSQIFDRLNRVQFSFDQSVLGGYPGVGIDAFVERLRSVAEQNPTADLLCITNTIRMAQQVYQHLTSKSLINESKDEIIYLSSNVRPIDRAHRLRELQEITATRQIVVSTQVVETGVDIDLDYVLRDFAPLDTIIQAAGRCNRNAISGDNVVDVMQLSADATSDTQSERYRQPPCAQVYDDVKLDSTRESLQKAASLEDIPEAKMLEQVLPDYFKQLPQRKQLDANRDHIQGWHFESGAISLIEKDAINIFIEMDSTDAALRTKFIQALEDENQQKVKKLKPAFYDRVVSIRRNRIDKDSFEDDAECLNEQSDLYTLAVGDEDTRTWYDGTVGFLIT